MNEMEYIITVRFTKPPLLPIRENYFCFDWDRYKFYKPIPELVGKLGYWKCKNTYNDDVFYTEYGLVIASSYEIAAPLEEGSTKNKFFGCADECDEYLYNMFRYNDCYNIDKELIGKKVEFIGVPPIVSYDMNGNPVYGNMEEYFDDSGTERICKKTGTVIRFKSYNIAYKDERLFIIETEDGKTVLQEPRYIRLVEEKRNDK